MKKFPGVFITLEGSEGSGKTTSLDFIANTLLSLGKPVLTTREPGGTRLGEGIRDLLLSDRKEAMSVDAELLLVFASRAQHLFEVVRPALEAGQWVVCSRFTDSTYAYQGGGRGMDLSRISALETWVHPDLQPDLTIFLDVPVETGLSRVKTRAVVDRIEQEDRAFFERVRQGYLQRTREYARCRSIDASQPWEQVSQEIKKILSLWVDSLWRADTVKGVSNSDGSLRGMKYEKS